MKINKVYKYILGSFQGQELGLVLTERRDWYQHVDMVDSFGILPLEGGFFSRETQVKPYRYSFYGGSVSAEVETNGAFFNEYLSKLILSGAIYYELTNPEDDIPVLLVLPNDFNRVFDIIKNTGINIRRITLNDIENIFGVILTDCWYENLNIVTK